jgi:peptide/nickel transport system substrate-binding protein
VIIGGADKRNQSPAGDKVLDELTEKVQGAPGEERRTLWRAAFKRIHEEIVPGVMLFHMAGHARVGHGSISNLPLGTNLGIPLEQIIVG